MENKIRYSIIYAVIRPEITERLSVGIITVDGDKLSVQYSRKKLNVLKQLYTPKEYEAISRIIRNDLQNIDSVDALLYLTRYSNNLIAFSPIQDIDTSNTGINQKWLYNNYVQSKLAV